MLVVSQVVLSFSFFSDFTQRNQIDSITSCGNQPIKPFTMLWNSKSATERNRISLFSREKYRNTLSSLRMSSTNVDEVSMLSLELEGEEESFYTTEQMLSKSQLINAALLIGSFGFSFYTILNIDHGVTRGWTANEIFMRIPFDNWRSYEDALSESPIVTKTMINVIIYLLGDWLSQTLFKDNNILDFDASRTLRNGFIGACFGPLVHAYYQFSDFIFPVVGMNRFYKIIMDQTIYLVTKCSMYILAVGVLSGESIEESATNVKTKIKGITITAWKFWPLVHCITYSAIPAQHRILWVNCVDLVWNAILASMAGNEEET